MNTLNCNARYVREGSLGLTTSQNSVANTDEHTLACALPGSGKSHTLIELTKRLLGKSESYTVLLITFTDAACKELSHRLENSLTARELARTRVKTFHSVAWQMYKENNSERLVIGADQYFFVERAMRDAGFNDEHAVAMEAIEFYGRQIKAEPSSTHNLAVYERYIEILKANRRVDFNMVCKKVYASLAQDSISPVRETHILVDEFQDTDKLQYLWLYEHGVRDKKLVVVGDDDQAIYSWRGAAGYQNMVDFQRDFNAVAYILDSCFRCGPNILEKAERLIGHNEDRVLKTMRSEAKVQGKVWLSAAKTAEEADKTFEHISKNASEWAVLARNNAQLDLIETLVKSHGISYQRLGGRGFWDNPIAIMFVKAMYVMVEPRSEHILADVLGFLCESEENINIILRLVKNRRIGFGDISYSADDNWLDTTKEFHGMWEKWQTPVADESETKVRIRSMLNLGKSIRSSKSERRIMEAVADILQQMTGTFEMNIKYLVERASTKKVNKSPGEEILTLATMHSSKGLQFKRVWIMGANEGVCPTNAAIEGDSVGGIEEERRLFYVGMTRAVEELVLSFALAKEKDVSRFVHEAAPDELKEVLEDFEKNFQ
jgi:DNA helicase II / ATP-dependent DNA helicase PcrA